MSSALGGRERRSFDLHARVRFFIAQSAEHAPAREPFDALALDIARYQADFVAPYARLLAASGASAARVGSVRELPAVPTDAFRVLRVAAHPEAQDVALFRTSGTTAGARGAHAFSTLDTYEAAALAWGRWGLFPDAPRELSAIVLTPTSDPGEPGFPGASSLGFMVGLFTRVFAATTSLVVARDGEDGGHVDPASLVRACEVACAEGRPVVMLGTSFSFVHALDALAGRGFALPPGSRAMHTGGFKGKSREVEPSVLRASIARAFGLELRAVVGEYGMTELSSQLYEGTLRQGLGLEAPQAAHGVFHAPPWMRVVAVEPATLAPLSEGERGLLRFEDLANIDSALLVQTADVGRVRRGAVELFGRAPDAVPRGCSIGADEWLSAAPAETR